MNRNIMFWIESMKLIVEKMGEKFTWDNAAGKALPFNDYIDEKIDSEQVIKDVDALFEILRNAYLNSKDNKCIDDFVAIFAIFCNLYIKAGFHLRSINVINIKESLNKVMYRVGNIIDDEKMVKYLGLIFKGIIYGENNSFVKAVEIFPEYQVPYLYLFLKTAKKAFVSDDNELNKSIALYYSKLNKGMQQYAIGQGEYIRISSNPAIDENLLPYISFESKKNKILRAMLSCYDSCEKNIINDVKDGKSLGKKEALDNGRYLLFFFMTKYVEGLSKKLKGEFDEFNFSLGTVFEKMKFLSEIQKNDENEKNRENEGQEESIEGLIFDKLQVLRLIGLGLPVEIESSREAFISRLEIVKLNNSLEKAIADKNALINKHAHNWKHIVYPQTVKEVAEQLYARGDIEYANKLFHAYNSQSLLQQDLNLLQLQYTSTPEEYRKAFRKTIYLVEDERGVGILNVFENALETVLFRLIMEDVDTRYALIALKNNLFSTVNRKALRDSYVKAFIISSDAKICVTEWFSQNLYPITIHVDDCWNDVKFKPNDIAFVQMTEVFIDLLHNALNYGLKSKDGYIEISFEKEIVEESCVYACTIKNPCENDSAFSEGSGQGLKSIYEVVDKLNSTDENSNINDFVVHFIQNNVFSITFKIQEKVLVKRRTK